MRRAWIPVVFAVTALAAGCQKDEGSGFKARAGSGSAEHVGSAGATVTPPRPRPGQKQVTQIKAPFDTTTPTADAIRTKSGLAYKKEVTVAGGEVPGKNDVVKVHYTGWKATGETMYSTTEKGGQPMAMPLQGIPPGFAEAILLMRKGEKAFLWIPADIGYREGAKPPTPEPMAYEVELIEISAAPPPPADLAKPPADAKKTKLGNPYIVIKPGISDQQCRSWDTTVFHLTAWDREGNQVESTEIGPQARPQNQPPFRQPKGLEDMLLSLNPGERARFWVPPDQLTFRDPPKADGVITVEVELQDIQKAPIDPPPVPADVAAPPPDVKKTARGVMWKLLEKGKAGGKSPVDTDTVSVNYTGWTTDGRMFDSSIIRGKPTEFPLKGVIQGWLDGLQVMKVGETVRFWIPEDMAYQGRPGKPAGMLVFDIELIDIKGPPPPPPPAPADVLSPPSDAKKSPKGVFYKVLKASKSGAQPGPTDVVKVHYSGWTTDGKLFDSSVSRGQPAEFPLNRVIPGWTDGLQLMKVGDSFRFWIPVELAYNNAPGKPAGMLVFDVELLDVQSAP